MAEKKSEGGGGITWLIAGFLLGVAVTLGGLAFLSHDPSDTPVQAQSAIVAPGAAEPADPGAAPTASPPLAGAPAPEAKADTPAAPAASTAPAAPSAPAAPVADNVDPEVADDAASVGMTSRAPTR